MPFDPPNGSLNEVGDDTFQTPSLYGFNEGQNITLIQDINVNVTPGGGAGVLSQNTVVASHYIFFDPAGNTNQTGWVDFDSEIIGIITSTAFLDSSDFLLNNNVNYLNPGLRGLESGDSALIALNNASRVNLGWRASSPGDFVRVLTAFSQGGTDPCSTNLPGPGGCPSGVPVPGTIGLFIALLCLLPASSSRFNSWFDKGWWGLLHPKYYHQKCG